MPIKQAAKKALRQGRVKAVINAKAKSSIKELVKDSRKLIEAKDKAKALENVRAAIKAIDKAVQRGILKKNNGARKKSRLMKKLNKIGK